MDQGAGLKDGPRAEPYFTAQRIESWLSHYGELAALAETPSSARGLLHPGPTVESPRVGAHQPGYHGDPNAWSDVRADIERAWLSLTRLSLEWRIVEARMHGHSIGAYAAEYHVPRREVHEANDRAVDQMAAYLEGARLVAFDRVDVGRRVIACETCGSPIEIDAFVTRTRNCSSTCRVRAWRARRRDMVAV